MSEIDSGLFRHVLGHFPTGVTVVAGLDGGEAVGLAVGSFFSISLDPALVGFCVGKSSSSWPRIERSGSFCVNILADDQEDVCRTFASSGHDKFADIDWEPAVETGSPRIDHVLGWIDCDHDVSHDAGDHWIVVGRVRALELGREGHPLVFFKGRYAHLER